MRTLAGLGPHLGVNSISPFHRSGLVRMANTKESREVFYSDAYSLLSGVVVHKGIEPHKAEEDMSPTGATTVSHLMPECPPPLGHTEKNQQKCREIANEPLEENC